MAFSRYNSILKSVKVAERQYGVKRIPIVLLKEMIKIAMFEDVKDKNLQIFVKHFNKTLDSILMFSIDNGKLFGDNCVSYMELKQWIDKLKAVFIEAQNAPIFKDQDYS